MERRPATTQVRRTASRAVRRGLLALLAAIVVGTTAPAAGAAQTEAFGVEPYPLFADGEARRVFELAISAGETWTDRIRVWNRSDEPVELRLYGAGAGREQGRYRVAPFESRDAGAGGWIETDPGTVRLEPGEERIVSVTVRAPARLPESEAGHLGAVVVEGAGGVSAGGFDVVTRLAILLVMEPGNRGILGLHPLVLVALALFALLGGAHAARRLGRRRGHRDHRPNPAAVR